jgi:uncharacterized protein YjbI with pentapeptide repeats
MQPMTVDQLTEILRLHTLWLQGAEGGQRANLEGVNLQRANLRRVNLQRADLREADLREADLREADLREADLEGANLQGADPGKNDHLMIVGQDMRGYIFYGWRNLDGVIVIKAGCRELVGIAAARTHWENRHASDEVLHADCLALVDRAAQMAAWRGWKLEPQGTP